MTPEERERRHAQYLAEAYQRLGPMSLMQRFRVVRNPGKYGIGKYVWARTRLDVILETEEHGSDQWKAAVIFRMAGLPDSQVESLCETGRLRLVEDSRDQAREASVRPPATSSGA